jgi:hypothetical protein
MPNGPGGRERPMPPPYNDPSAALFDRRDRKPPPPRSGGRYAVAPSVMFKHLTQVVFDSQFWSSIVSERSPCVIQLLDRSSIGFPARTACPCQE